MKRQISGLSKIDVGPEIPSGSYLVRIQHARYCWHRQKPAYELQFCILEPESLKGGAITGCLECKSKALWKLAWMLRDFRYSHELLERDELDDRALIGLEGIMRISHEVINGRSVTRLDGFAPAADWEPESRPSGSQVERIA